MIALWGLQDESGKDFRTNALIICWGVCLYVWVGVFLFTIKNRGKTQKNKE